MSADLDHHHGADSVAITDQRTIPAGRTGPFRRLIIPLACLVAGAALGVAASLGVLGLSQKPQSTLSGAAAELPSLAQPQHQADLLPTGIPGFDSALIVDGSSRLAGRTPTASYYLAVSPDGRACLLILPSNTSKPWAQACAARLPFGVAAAGSGSARIVPSDSTAPAGTIRMGLNVIVDPDSTSLIN